MAPYDTARPAPRLARAGDDEVWFVPVISQSIAIVSLAADEPAGEGGGGLGSLLPPLLIVGVIFWLLVFRPASRERKAREEKIKSLKKHDRVVTNAGIHGTVVALDPETVTLRVDDKSNVRIRFSRAAVWEVEDAEAAGAEAEPKREKAPAR